MTTPPIGGAGWRAAAAGAHQLSPLARSTLEGARTLGATNGQHLADAIARLPDAAQRRQVLQEVAPELAPSELAATQSALRERGVDVGTPTAGGGQPKANADAALKGAGLPEAFANLLADSDAGAAKGGLFDDSRTLSTLIGRPTTPIHDSIREIV